MATLDDVISALANLLNGVVYPNGVDLQSIAAVDIAIHEGWPIGKQIDDYVVKGKGIIVSIYPSDIETNTTRGLGNQYTELANDGTTGQSLKEVKRQQRQFMISIWTNDPAVRGTVVGAIDASLSDTFRFSLSDGSIANMKYARSTHSDKTQNEDVYRGDLYYDVEFSTTKIETDFVVKSNTITVTPTFK